MRVCCGDWSRICGPTPTVKQGLTGVLLDPPYADTAARTEQLYAVDSTVIAHDVRTWALEWGDDPRMRIALCGYEGEHETTAEVMRAGRYHTGDIATRDADGYYFYVGRNDDVFKCSDYRISPFELESVLLEHEKVAEAAVVPSPDPIRLAVPKAYVLLTAGAERSRDTPRSTTLCHS